MLVKSSMNHRVRARQHRLWDRESQRFRGLQVDHELEFRWLLYGQFGWLGALKNPVDVAAARPMKSDMFIA
jgi:hypothetical protein